MMNCREISRLVSEREDHELPFWQRMRVAVHLAMCFLCRRFAKQMKLIRTVSRAAGQTSTLVADAGLMQQTSLPPEAKQRIRDKVASSQPEDGV